MEIELVAEENGFIENAINNANVDESLEETLKDKEKLGLSEVNRPLEVGLRVPCKWRDSTWQEAEILERRESSSCSKQYEYYVHYCGFNRRLDEWVDGSRIDWKAVEERKLSYNNLSNKKKRDKKRKLTQEGEKKTEKNQVENVTKVKNVDRIVLGKYVMETWYYSPLPPEYNHCSTLWVCEYTLQFFRSEEALKRFQSRHQIRFPPGNEIYRKDNISMFEVDGAKQKLYCQNLSYLAKFFLDHKTLYYDVDPFWFYVMCEYDDRGGHIVGYFSKEKESEDNYNVACILTFPAYQRKGYGKFLIAFSYELSKIEQKLGSPEKPLSDLGLLSYRSYWSHVLVDLLKSEKQSISIQEISERTMMKIEDIISTLQVLGLIQYYEGQHVLDLRRIDNIKLGSRGLPCDPSCIKWTPKTSFGIKRK
eukprot:jgi/Galph1/4933/GphlegSOOS_G3504.1